MRYEVFLKGNEWPSSVPITGCDMSTTPDGELYFYDDLGDAFRFAAGTWRYVVRLPDCILTVPA